MALESEYAIALANMQMYYTLFVRVLKKTRQLKCINVSDISKNSISHIQIAGQQLI
jgi:hypothetical protein